MELKGKNAIVTGAAARDRAYEGTYDVQTLILGREITGESAFD